MVQAGSSSMAENFHKKKLMGYFLLFMRAAGVLSRYINGACCVTINHVRRMQMVTIFSVISFLGIAVAAANTKDVSYFYVALFCSIFMGVA